METTAGSVTSTKQFVWASDRKRPFQPSEERDGSGALTKKFFARGQMNSVTKYFYDSDHLGSVREMTDNTGGVQAEYVFDPYGRMTKLSETVASDFGYAGYYSHLRSGLSLATFRAFSAGLGRWISRDPIGEDGGINQYQYVVNNSINRSDRSGLAPGGGAGLAAPNPMLPPSLVEPPPSAPDSPQFPIPYPLPPINDPTGGPFLPAPLPALFDPFFVPGRPLFCLQRLLATPMYGTMDSVYGPPPNTIPSSGNPTLPPILITP